MEKERQAWLQRYKDMKEGKWKPESTTTKQKKEKKKDK
jgi:hypothetical protein